MNEETKALYQALRDLATNVDEDVPVEARSRHINNALAYAFELVEVYAETTTPQNQ